EDRQDDDTGIQMVIPAFYAGDTHGVMLDLITDNPGALADVSVRYKDLMHLRNATAEARWVLDRGTDENRPAQRAVTVNRLAYQLSLALRQAGDLAASGNLAAARQRLASA